jgi:hypothetical protein
MPIQWTTDVESYRVCSHAQHHEDPSQQLVNLKPLSETEELVPTGLHQRGGLGEEAGEVREIQPLADCQNKRHIHHVQLLHRSIGPGI